MYDEVDRKTFEQQVAWTLDDVHQSTAVAFQFRMRDSVGNAIHMELFQSRFEGDDSRVRYLVGFESFGSVSRRWSNS
jgi:hypothetical protein